MKHAVATEHVLDGGLSPNPQPQLLPTYSTCMTEGSVQTVVERHLTHETYTVPYGTYRHPHTSHTKLQSHDSARS